MNQIKSTLLRTRLLPLCLSQTVMNLKKTYLQYIHSIRNSGFRFQSVQISSCILLIDCAKIYLMNF